MLRRDPKYWIGASLLTVILVVDFYMNVFVSLDSDKSLLQSGDIRSYESVTEGEQTLPSINMLFGLKEDSHSDTSSEAEQESEAEQARLEQERLEQEQRERERQQLLSVGEDNIRLFGLSLSGKVNTALISVNLLEDKRRVLELKEGESFSLADGQVELTIMKVNVSSVDIEIDNKLSGKLETFNLVMFEYEI